MERLSKQVNQIKDEQRHTGDRRRLLEKALIILRPSLSALLEQPDEEMQGIKEDEDDNFDDDLKRSATSHMTEANGINSCRSEREFEGEAFRRWE
jgi:predicted  nucleic acid-binding Zn-ribbon protein